MSIFKGSAVALVTPFTPDGSKIDVERLISLIEFHIENGTDAILVNGTTGESPTQSKEEFELLVSTTVQAVAKRVPVIAGAGSNNTTHSLELSLSAQNMGADALLLITPYYNKGTQTGNLQHFIAVADRVDIPIILYNVPGRTGINLLPETIAKAAEHPNIVAVKEASGKIEQVLKIRELCGSDFDIYSGNDDIIVPTLACGGVGVISVLANVAPTATHEMVMEYLNGNTNTALEMQLKYNPLVRALFTEPNPIAVKRAMELINMSCGPLRLPLTPLEEPHEAQLIEALKDLSLI
ncbi:MAG: 4-hydroxy-tetrahydrodipicolinate synthase [Tissierellia bacterium]|nr:4-hydroxy-tetrahydrodipicolinate synthase [Tissierellia bacterium]